jgi:hypothetical protein
MAGCCPDGSVRKESVAGVASVVGVVNGATSSLTSPGVIFGGSAQGCMISSLGQWTMPS